jgi:pimeloyl-ACP methyl ester carboxylesterase
MDNKVKKTIIRLKDRDGDPDFHLATYQAGSGPAVVFCHGFPDIALGWQHQLPAVAAAGYHAIAPDMRGYGDSSCPQPIEAYGIAELAGDLVALLDKLEIDKAIFVGHDWGGFVAWSMPVLHPERVLGIAAGCTPYIPFPSIEKHLEVVKGDLMRQYVAWFQDPDVAESYMDQFVSTIVDRIMRTGAPLKEIYAAAYADGKLDMNPFHPLTNEPALLGEPLLSNKDRQAYIEAFEKTGFRGGINWYRNIDQNALNFPAIGVQALDIPCLMLMADLDPALRPEYAADMPDRCSNLEMHLIQNAAHWVQQEQPQIFNQHLIEWLNRHFSED